PSGARVLFQVLCTYEGEAGVFYVRQPGEKIGKITSITLKYFPSVTGDGYSTLEELILKDPRAAHFKEAYFARNKAHLTRVIPLGEKVKLVTVGNHCRGAIFRNGEAAITSELTTKIDQIAKEIPEFYMGRFDIRFQSFEELKKGEGLAI